MTATITTDASFYVQHKKGAFAFWISTEERIIQKAGVLKGACLTSQIAEIKAILNSLIFIKRARFSEKITHITVNTDCMDAINLLGVMTNEQLQKHCNKSKSEALTFLPEAWLAIKVALQAEIKFKHVKAHKGKDTARKFVNDWCDKAAKKELRQFIKNEKQNAIRN